MTQEPEHYVDAPDDKMAPIPVQVVEAITENKAPDFGVFQTVTVPTLAGGGPIQILRRWPFRQKAYISNTQTAAPTAIILANRIEYLMGPTAVGFQLNPGVTQEYDAQQPVYAVAIATPETISILDQGWES